MWLSDAATAKLTAFIGCDRYSKQMIHNDQIRFCWSVVTDLRKDGIPVSPAYLRELFPRGVQNHLWSATHGRLTAMILQLARYGDFPSHETF